MATFAVTGSAGGLGSAIRARIEAEGHSVVGVDLRGAEVMADLSQPSEREAAWAEVRRSCGGRLAGVVACAGLGGTAKPTSLVARVNYFGAVSTLDGLLPLLAAELQEGGTPGSGEADEGLAGPAAVAICSNSASFFSSGDHPLVNQMLEGDEAGVSAAADGLDGQLVYSQSKLALARALRRRVPDWATAGVRLNGVAPGPVLTPLTREGLDDPVAGPLIRDFPVPLGRWGEPEEIAAAVWFLLSAQAAWVHGSILFVDGGTDAVVRPEGL